MRNLRPNPSPRMRSGLLPIWMVLALGMPATVLPAFAQSVPNAAGASRTVPDPSDSAMAESAGAPASPTSAAGTQGSADLAALPAAPGARAATVSGTVLDTNDNVVPGAKISVETVAGGDRHQFVANDNAAFSVDSLQPGTAYVFTVSADGFLDWTSAPVTLQPGQFLYLRDVRLKVKADATSITVYASRDQIATEQVKLEEQQRVLGFVPNYYVNYEGADAAPMPSRMKFQLAMRTATDPVTIAGVVLLAGMYQAGDTPNYREGAAGYGERVGAIGAEGFANIMIGGAILPSVLHQDPRYFYQGTGSTKSRMLHALTAPLIAHGDNGHAQINVSSMGGDLATGALMNALYPASNRGAGLVFTSFGLATGERAINGVLQEFLLPRFTSRGRPPQE
jgi:hypothetical protein